MSGELLLLCLVLAGFRGFMPSTHYSTELQHSLMLLLRLKFPPTPTKPSWLQFEFTLPLIGELAYAILHTNRTYTGVAFWWHCSENHLWSSICPVSYLPLTQQSHWST